MNENENTIYHNLCDAAKTTNREKFIAIWPISEKKKGLNNDLHFHIMKPDIHEQSKP